MARARAVPSVGIAPRWSVQLAKELALVAVTILIFVVLVYPTAWVFVASFRTPETMFSSGRHIYTLDNYIVLLSSEFARSIFNSLFLCIASVLVSTFVAVIAAYVFSRMRFRWKAVLFGSVMMGQTFPWIILVTPVFVLFAQVGLLNNYAGMIFVYVRSRSRSRSICWSDIWNRCPARSTKRPSWTGARAAR